jgi:hypothetical protein
VKIIVLNKRENVIKGNSSGKLLFCWKLEKKMRKKFEKNGAKVFPFFGRFIGGFFGGGKLEELLYRILDLPN